MTYEDIVAKTRELMSELDASGYNGHLAVEICITGEGEGVYYIEVTNGAINVEPYDYHDCDCRLTAAALDLLNIVTGKLDAVAAFTFGKLKVEGSIEKALEFQKFLNNARK